MPRTKKNTDVICNYTENIDISMLNKIIYNYDKLVEQKLIPRTCKGDKQIDLKYVLKKLLNKAQNNEPTYYNYADGKNEGRLYAQSVSLQNIPSNIRNTIIDTTKVVDIDMVNASWSLFSQYCFQNEIPSDNIFNFCINRQKYMEECDGFLSRKEFKEQCYLLLFKDEQQPKYKGLENLRWFQDLAQEMKYTKNVIKLKNKTLIKQLKLTNDENAMGKVIAHLVFNMESNCLNKLRSFMDEEGIKICFLSFDGLCVYKEEDREYDEKFLQELSNIAGIHLAVKKMNQKLNMDEFEDAIEAVPKDLIVRENYFFGDFRKALINNTFKDINELSNFVIVNLSRVCVCVLGAEDKFYVKYENKCFYPEDLKFKVQYMVEKEKNNTISVKKTKINFTDLLEDIGNKIPWYNGVCYKPINGSVVKQGGETLYNIFIGPKASFIDKVDTTKIQPILDHIFEIWADSNQEYYDWLMMWFAHLIQKPAEKSEVVPIIFSPEEGTGKGVILEFLAQHVLGSHYCAKTNDMDRLTGQFNSMFCEKRLIILDDPSKDYSERRSSVWGKLRGLITEQTQSIEYKGRDIEKIDDFTNYIIATNEPNIIRIKTEDRRFVVFQCSNKRVKDFDYFRDLQSKLTEETANHFITYLNQYEGVDVSKIRRLPQTSIRKEIQELTQTQPEKFMRDIEEGVFVLDIPMEECSEDGWIATQGILRAFNEWCGLNGEKRDKYTTTKLTQSLKALKCEYKKVRIGDKTFRAMQLPFKVVLEKQKDGIKSYNVKVDK